MINNLETGVNSFNLISSADLRISRKRREERKKKGSNYINIMIVQESINACKAYDDSLTTHRKDGNPSLFRTDFDMYE